MHGHPLPCARWCWNDSCMFVLLLSFAFCLYAAESSLFRGLVQASLLVGSGKSRSTLSERVYIYWESCWWVCSIFAKGSNVVRSTQVLIQHIQVQQTSWHCWKIWEVDQPVLLTLYSVSCSQRELQIFYQGILSLLCNVAVRKKLLEVSCCFLNNDRKKAILCRIYIFIRLSRGS